VATRNFNVKNGLTAGNITLDATTNNITTTGNLTAANLIGIYANGNSNINIPAANGNIRVSVAGVANIATFTNNAVFRGSYGLTGSISQANTAPANPQPGDQWYNTFNGILFEYIDDGTSLQWVDISGLPLPNIAGSNAAAVLNNVQSTGTYFPAFISSTANGNYQLNSNTAFSANLANGAMIATTFVGALSGAATSATTAGTVTTAAQPNITSVGTLTSLSVTGNVTVGNLLGVFANGNSNVSIPAANGNVNISAAGNANVLVVAGSGVRTNSPLSINVGLGSGYFLDIATGTGQLGIRTAGTGSGIYNDLNSPNTIFRTQVVDNVSVSIATIATGSATSGPRISLAPNNTAMMNVTTTGANVFGTLNATGNANVGNLGTAQVLATANITAPQLISNVATGTAPLIVTSTTQVANLNVATAGSATTAGTVTTAAQPNITSVGTLTSATVTGNVAAGNLTTTGVLSVTGTGVSSIAGNLDMTSNTIINLATPTNANDAATKQYVDDVAQGLHTHDTCNAATSTTLATASGGTVTYNNGTSGVGATLTTTGSYTTIDGVTLSNGMRILVKNEANTAHNGIYDRTSTTVLTRSTDFDTPAEMAGGDFTFITAGTLYDNTGWVMTDPVTTVGTSPVPWVQFSGAGTYTAGTGLTLTGSQFSVNASQTQVTSVGTLTGLNSSGTITAPAFTANTGVFTGNGSALTALNASNISSGTLAQARLANASLTVNGTSITLGGSGTITATATNALTIGTGLGGTSYNGSTGVTITNTGVTSIVAGTNIAVSGATGAVTVSVTGTVPTATTAGTVTTAAQPNITSVGTLTGLTVSTGTGQVLTSTDAGGSMSFGLTSGSASTPYIDFNTSATAVDYNVRIQASGNTASIGSGTLSLQAATTTISGSLQTTALTTGANTTAGTVTGNWTLTAGSRWQATYADLAEKYVADATYEPGTVLLFGGEQEVTLSNAFDSTKVAGVVTTNPAYSMNAMLEAEYVAEIALQGRVPCKVQGPVEKGDLMVSANNGHATANNDARAGTIIGKALENFNGDFGIIEVAVGRF
jgi:hypothetical protein